MKLAPVAEVEANLLGVVRTIQRRKAGGEGDGYMREAATIHTHACIHTHTYVDNHHTGQPIPSRAEQSHRHYRLA